MEAELRGRGSAGGVHLTRRHDPHVGMVGKRKFGGLGCAPGEMLRSLFVEVQAIEVRRECGHRLMGEPTLFSSDEQ